MLRCSAVLHPIISHYTSTSRYQTLHCIPASIPAYLTWTSCFPTSLAIVCITVLSNKQKYSQIPMSFIFFRSINQTVYFACLKNPSADFGGWIIPPPKSLSDTRLGIGSIHVGGPVIGCIFVQPFEWSNMAGWKIREEIVKHPLKSHSIPTKSP